MISLAEIAAGKKAGAMIATKRVVYIHPYETDKQELNQSKAAPIQVS